MLQLVRQREGQEFRLNGPDRQSRRPPHLLHPHAVLNRPDLGGRIVSAGSGRGALPRADPIWFGHAGQRNVFGAWVNEGRLPTAKLANFRVAPDLSWRDEGGASVGAT